jgi:hypothetical protein
LGEAFAVVVARGEALRVNHAYGMADREQEGAAAPPTRSTPDSGKRLRMW